MTPARVRAARAPKPPQDIAKAVEEERALEAEFPPPAKKGKKATGDKSNEEPDPRNERPREDVDEETVLKAWERLDQKRGALRTGSRRA